MADTLDNAQPIGGVSVEVRADLSPLRAGIADAKKIAASVEQGGARIVIGADTSKAKTAIADLGKPGTVKLPVLADTAKAKAEIGLLGAPLKVPLQLDTSAAKNEMRLFAQGARIGPTVQGVPPLITAPRARAGYVEEQAFQRAALEGLAKDAGDQLRSAVADADADRTRRGFSGGGSSDGFGGLHRRGNANYLSGRGLEHLLGNATAGFATFEALRVVGQTTELAVQSDKDRREFGAGYAGPKAGLGALGTVESVPILGQIVQVSANLTGLQPKLELLAEAAKATTIAIADATEKNKDYALSFATLSGDVAKAAQATVHQQYQANIEPLVAAANARIRAAGGKQEVNASSIRPEDFGDENDPNLSTVQRREVHELRHGLAQARAVRDAQIDQVNRQQQARMAAAPEIIAGYEATGQAAVAAAGHDSAEATRQNYAAQFARLDAEQKQGLAEFPVGSEEYNHRLSEFTARRQSLTREQYAAAQQNQEQRQLASGRADFAQQETEMRAGGQGENEIARRRIQFDYGQRIQQADVADRPELARERNAAAQELERQQGRERGQMAAAGTSQILQSNLRIGFRRDEAEQEGIRQSYRPRIEEAQEKFGKDSIEAKQVEAERDAKLAEQTAQVKVRVTNTVAAAEADVRIATLRANKDSYAADLASFQEAQRRKMEAMKQSGATAKEVAAQQEADAAELKEFQTQQGRQRQQATLGYQTRQAVAVASGQQLDQLAGVIAQIGQLRQERIAAPKDQQGEVAKTQLMELDALKKQLTRPTGYAIGLDVGHEAIGGPTGQSGKDLAASLKAIDAERGRIVAGDKVAAVVAPSPLSQNAVALKANDQAGLTNPAFANKPDLEIEQLAISEEGRAAHPAIYSKEDVESAKATATAARDEMESRRKAREELEAQRKLLANPAARTAATGSAPAPSGMYIGHDEPQGTPMYAGDEAPVATRLTAQQSARQRAAYVHQNQEQLEKARGQLRAAHTPQQRQAAQQHIQDLNDEREARLHPRAGRAVAVDSGARAVQGTPQPARGLDVAGTSPDTDLLKEIRDLLKSLNEKPPQGLAS